MGGGGERPTPLLRTGLCDGNSYRILFKKRKLILYHINAIELAQFKSYIYNNAESQNKNSLLFQLQHSSKDFELERTIIYKKHSILITYCR